MLAVTLTVENNQFCKLSTKLGVIAQLCTRNQFTICVEKTVNIHYVQADQAHSVAATLARLVM